MNLKWSQFIFWVDSLNDKNKVIIRNTLTGSIVKVEKRIKQSIDDFLKNEKGISQKKFRNYISQLVKLGILVPIGLDESEVYYKFFQRIRKNSSIFVVYIATTTNCQLNCPYC